MFPAFVNAVVLLICLQQFAVDAARNRARSKTASRLLQVKSTFAFENHDSRYDNWLTLETIAQCPLNVTQCTVLMYTVDGVLVRNFYENFTGVYHLVQDQDFRCHERVIWRTQQCAYKESKYGLIPRINPDCFATADCTLVDFGCPVATVGMSRVFYDGKCEITVYRGIKPQILLKAIDKFDICYEIFIDGQPHDSGVVGPNNPLTATLNLKGVSHMVRVTCGANDLSVMLTLSKYPKCVFWLMKTGVSNHVSEVFCEYFYFFRFIIIGIFVTLVFATLHTFGLKPLMILVYMAMLSPIIFIQRFLARDKFCKTCASRLYWLIPHIKCRMSCSRCEVFSSSNYAELYSHKELCENAHNRYSTMDMAKYLVSRKSLYYMARLITICIVIWFICTLPIAEAAHTGNAQHVDMRAAASFNMYAAPEKVYGMRGGDIIQMPNAHTVFVFGGNSLQEGDAPTVRNVADDFADDLKRAGNRAGTSSYIPNDQPSNVVDRFKAALRMSAEQIKDSNTKSAEQIREEASKVVHKLHEMNDKWKLSSRNTSAAIDAIKDNYNRIEAEWSALKKWIYHFKQQYKDKIPAEYQAQYDEAIRRRDALNDMLDIEDDKLSVIERPARRQKRTVTFTSRATGVATMAQNLDAVSEMMLHQIFVKSANDHKAATIKPVSPGYIVRGGAFDENCVSNDVWIDSHSSDGGQNQISVKLQANFPLTTGSCSVFNLKFEDQTIEDTQLIVKVLHTGITYPVTELYSTFKTQSFTTIPHELCVESEKDCRDDLRKWNVEFLKKGGLIKSWPNCQSTGCEMPWCAIASGGCCALICRDVVDPDSRVNVYEIGAPIFNVELCYKIPGVQDCVQIAGSASQKIQDFEFVNTYTEYDSIFKKTSLIAVPNKSKTILIGDICNVGDYCNGFGSLQMEDGIMHGEAAIEAYWHCQFVALHTYEVSRCYKNTYSRLANLKPVAPEKAVLLNDGKGDFIRENNLNLGSMTWSANLRNVIVSRKEQEINVDARIMNCSGCYRCLQHAACHLSIDSTGTFAGRFECADVFTYSQTIGISRGMHSYLVYLDVRSSNPALKCVIQGPSKKYDIAPPAGGVQFEKGNVTWDDDAVDPVHVVPKGSGGMMINWNWFNPFSALGWYNYFAILKIIILFIIICAIIVGILFLSKRALWMWTSIKEIADIAGTNSTLTFKGYPKTTLLPKRVVRKYE